MNSNSILAAAAILTGLLSGEQQLLAQGADQCANAQPIQGLGAFAFDNAAATLDGSPDPLCFAFGTDDIDHDVWFAWTSAQSGYFELTTCNQTAVDTKVGIYDGSCAGSVLACAEDSCAYQTQVIWAGNAGSTYLIRLGTFPGASGGTGSFKIGKVEPAFNPANGHYYLVIDHPGIGWNEAEIAAEALPHLGLPGHLATLTDAGENDFVYALGVVHRHWIGGYQDLNDPAYVEPGGAWKWVTGEPWSYTNWLAGEPSNSGGFASEDFLELLQRATHNSTWNDVHPMEHPAGFVIEWDSGMPIVYCFGDGSGTGCPCFNLGGIGEGCANSSGSGAVLTSGGSPSVSADDIRFAGAHLLANQPALLFVGNNAVNGGAGSPFGDGLRCAGGDVRRLGVKLPHAGGGTTWGPGLAALGGWAPGDVRRFQAWYRDPNGSPCGANFNLSHGIEILFVP